MARELCGGNGIILDNHVMKALIDIETIHTYEGTYEVNMLVSGREITGGIAAFKWPVKVLKLVINKQIIKYY